MEGPREDEIAVCTDLVEAGVGEGLIVDQASSLVDDDQGEDGPAMRQQHRGIATGEGRD